MSNIFDTLLVIPIINILVAIYTLLSILHLPYALGFSIIALTALMRLILFPLTAQQLKSSKKMQDLNPHLSTLRDKHKGDAKTLQAETMKLYKEHGVNPIAGCLPLLVQLPFIWALYTVLDKVVRLDSGAVLSYINGLLYFEPLKLTKVWDPNFFGLPLGKSPADLIGSIGIVILVLPLITGITQFIQSKMLFPSKPPLKPGEKRKEDFASSFQTQSTYIFPIMIGVLSFTFPIGLSLYWNTFTVFGIIQQYQIQGWGGLSPWIKKLKKQ